MSPAETHGAPSLLDTPRVAAELARLHALSDRQSRRSLRLLYLRRTVARMLTGRPADWGAPSARATLADKLVAIDPWKGQLCHFLCRTTRAKRVVEVGTSFGVSTIYLAAAVRENLDEDGGSGMVIGSEWEPQKVEGARANLVRAGLADVVDIREGDIRDTLEHVDPAIDFVLMDIWAPMARPALDMLVPKLRPGAVVLCDNVVRFKSEYREYLERVRDPAGGFFSTTLPDGGGVELSTWMERRGP